MSTSNVDKLLRSAIAHKRLRFSYGGRDRVLESHDYGVQNGCTRLLAYQTGGASSGKLPNWRWFDVAGISAVEVLDQHFKGGRPAPSRKHHVWDELLIRVEPSNEKPA